MSYRDCVKQQIITYIVYVLVFSVTYGLGFYFKWGSPIIITSNHIGIFIGGTFSHIFLFPLYLKWFNSLKK